MRRWFLLSVASLTPLVLGTAAAADEHETGDPWDRGAHADGVVEDGGVDTSVKNETERDANPGPSAQPVRNGSTCDARAVEDGFQREKMLADDLLIPRRAVFYWLECDGSESLRYWLPGRPPAEDPVFGRLVEEAVGRVEPPVPRLVTSPPLGSEVLTGMPMYLAVDDPAFSEQTGSVSAGQFTVTATVRPVSSWFSPGDQHEPVVCEGAGSVWSHGERPTEGDCTHTFTHTPAHLNGAGEVFTLTSRVTYEASYTVEGPILAGTYELGTFEGPEAQVDIPVVERRAVRTTANG